MTSKKTALSLVIGSAFAASIAAAPVASAADNPFEMNSLKNGYQVAGVAKGEENKCGGDKGTEAKCGEDKGGEAKCGENKCGGSK
jgi:uncharacterized low-complexity protein